MRVIDVNKRNQQRITALLYGGPRSGKTQIAATAPKPCFISDGRESGWETIQNMQRSLFYDPAFTPIVYAIDAMPDFHQAMALIRPQVESGAIETVVIDSLTFHADLVFNALVKAQAKEDMRKVYGDLSNYLRNLRDTIHSLNCNIIWLCLEKSPSEDNPQGLPMIPGQQQVKFAAGCDYILYQRSTEVNGKVQYFTHTRRYGPFYAGGRDGGRLPPVMENARFEHLRDALKNDAPLALEPTVSSAPSTSPQQGKAILRKKVASNGTAPSPRR